MLGCETLEDVGVVPGVIPSAVGLDMVFVDCVIPLDDESACAVGGLVVLL